jgi:hypothetical protein
MCFLVLTDSIDFGTCSKIIELSETEIQKLLRLANWEIARANFRW